MNAGAAQKDLAGAAVALAVLSMAGGLLIILGLDQLDIGGDIARSGIGSLVVAAGGTVILGLWLSSRDAREGR